MSKLLERFINYVKIDTTSVEDSEVIPSSEGQWELAKFLEAEMKALGLEDVYVDEHCFAYGTIPPTKGFEHVSAIGLLAHLDTAPECSGKNVKPLVHKAYDGGTLIVNKELDITIAPSEYPDIARYVGDDLVTSDGTTLLGADDKGGIAIIMDVAETLMSKEAPSHGKVRIAFTPDEEVSYGGAAIFDAEAFGVDFALTVDGDGVGEFNIETFYAYTGTVKIKGVNMHTGEAKGKMVNSITLAMALDELIPRDQRAEHSEGHEGFYHLSDFNGTVEETELSYLLRDFEKEGLSKKISLLEKAVEEVNLKYGGDYISLKGEYEYSNMGDVIKEREGLAELCLSAFRDCGLTPTVVPIRGGTDGSTLSEKGLPCPNIFIGGHHYHSLREFVSVNAMEKASKIVTKIITNWSNKG